MSYFSLSDILLIYNSDFIIVFRISIKQRQIFSFNFKFLFNNKSIKILNILLFSLKLLSN